jgi:hypothetical protein
VSLERSAVTSIFVNSQLTLYQEFVLGLGEGVGDIVWHPYIGAKREGPLGAMEGIGRGLTGFGCHTLAGTYTSNFCCKSALC